VRRRIRAIARKEFLHIIRDPRSLIVVVALPLVMLLIYGNGINLDVRHIRAAVLDEDGTRASRELLDAFGQSGYFDFRVRMRALKELDGLMDGARVKAAVVVPRGFAADVARGEGKVQIVVDGSDATPASLAASYGTRIVEEFSRRKARTEIMRRGLGENALPGLELSTRYWYNPELTSSHFVVPGLVAIILMLLSALLTSTTIVRERERGSIEQIVVSPIRPAELMIGKLIPYVVIAYADIWLTLLVGTVVFGVPINGSIPLLMAASALYLVAALGLGLVISVISHSQLMAMMTAVLATMLPSILLSGFVFPISTMPTPIRAFTYLIPARYFLVIVRGILLKGVGAAVLWPQGLMLIVLGAALVAVAARKFRKVL